MYKEFTIARPVRLFLPVSNTVPMSYQYMKRCDWMKFYGGAMHCTEKQKQKQEGEKNGARRRQAAQLDLHDSYIVQMQLRLKFNNISNSVESVWGRDPLKDHPGLYIVFVLIHTQQFPQQGQNIGFFPLFLQKKQTMLGQMELQTKEILKVELMNVKIFTCRPY